MRCFGHEVVIRKYLQGKCLELFFLLTAAEDDHLAEMAQLLAFVVSASACNCDGPFLLISASVPSRVILEEGGGASVCFITWVL